MQNFHSSSLLGPRLSPIQLRTTINNGNKNGRFGNSVGLHVFHVEADILCNFRSVKCQLQHGIYTARIMAQATEIRNHPKQHMCSENNSIGFVLSCAQNFQCYSHILHYICHVKYDNNTGNSGLRQDGDHQVHRRSLDVHISR